MTRVEARGQPHVLFCGTPSTLVFEMECLTFVWNVPVWLGWLANLSPPACLSYSSVAVTRYQRQLTEERVCLVYSSSRLIVHNDIAKVAGGKGAHISELQAGSTRGGGDSSKTSPETCFLQQLHTSQVSLNNQGPRMQSPETHGEHLTQNTVRLRVLCLEYTAVHCVCLGPTENRRGCWIPWG